MHPINSFSTHPVFYSNRGQTTKSFTSENKFEELKPVHVGNDVWIGASAVVMDGVTISDGAIIAAGAIVTKDVRPYAIVAGVPAKEVRRRFDDNKIEELLEWKWWNLSERQLHILAENFRSDGLWTVAALNEAVESK
jgi:acetyltransferase-like isoleucine patch superfamily enzyme